MSRLFVSQRFIAPRWKLHSAVLSLQHPAQMNVQILDVTQSVHMDVLLDTTWQAEINL